MYWRSHFRLRTRCRAVEQRLFRIEAKKLGLLLEPEDDIPEGENGEGFDDRLTGAKLRACHTLAQKEFDDDWSDVTYGVGKPPVTWPAKRYKRMRGGFPKVS